MLRKNKKSKYNLDSIALKFNHPAVSKKLTTWIRTRGLVQKTMDAGMNLIRKKFADMGAKAGEIKQYLIDDGMVVKKSSEGIIIKFQMRRRIKTC